MRSAGRHDPGLRRGVGGDDHGAERRRTPDGPDGAGPPPGPATGAATPRRIARDRADPTRAAAVRRPRRAASTPSQISQGFLSVLGPGLPPPPLPADRPIAGILPAHGARPRGRRWDSSPARPTWPASTGASSSMTGSRPRSALPAPGARRLAPGARHPRPRRPPTGPGAGRGAELLAVAVDPAWQGQGVGRRLVDGVPRPRSTARGGTRPTWWWGPTTRRPCRSTSEPGS